MSLCLSYFRFKCYMICIIQTVGASVIDILLRMQYCYNNVHPSKYGEKKTKQKTKMENLTWNIIIHNWQVFSRNKWCRLCTCAFIHNIDQIEIQIVQFGR